MHSKLLGLFLLALISLSSNANNRLIIKYKNTTQTYRSFGANLYPTHPIQPLNATQINNISTATNAQVRYLHTIPNGAHVITLNINTNESDMQQMINLIKEDPTVEYVEEDRILKHVTNPAINTEQWDMQLTSAALSGSGTWVGNNFTGAWPIVPSYLPGNGVTVSVIDTGYTPHPNFISNLQTLSTGSSQYGYQFISDCRVAGSCPATTSNSAAYLAPQADGLDLGDFISSSDAQTTFFSGCTVTNSSWHGSHVTGTIIGQGYNSSTMQGILGGAYSAKVVPVRVLGKCGGYTSDIISGMYWAAGFSVSGATINPNPAKVINMSLGGSGSCGTAQQDAINQIAAEGVIMVAAAGNSHSNVSYFNPASCNNIISVASVGPTQALASYSNYGNTTITAAGGNTSSPYNTNGGVYSTIWSSTQQYESTMYGGYGTYTYYQGTSQATPHASAAIADIIATLTTNSTPYNLALIEQIIESSALYNYTSCSIYGCAYSGVLNTESAVLYTEALTNVVSPSPSSVTFTSGSASSATITFTNNTESTFEIESVVISSSTASATTDSKVGISRSTASVPTINTNNCNTTLDPASSCQVQIAWGNSNSTLTALLQLFSPSNEVLSTVTINNNGTITPVVNPTSGGGGGCSMIQNGNDASIYLLLGIVALFGIRRYLRYKFLSLLRKV